MIKRTWLVAAAAAALAGGTASAQDIRIGVLYPLTGGAASFGESALLGHNMLVEEINAAGGINGRKIVTASRDSKGSPNDATAAARELITLEKVDFLVGGLTSAEGLAISEVSKAEKKIYIASIPKTISLTEGERFHKYVFRSAANTNTEGGSAALIAAEQGWKRICTILFDYAYGWDLDKGFKKVLAQKAPDAKIVLELRPKFPTQDYSSFITQLMGARCDGVFGNMFGGFFITFAQQAAPFGLFRSTKVVMAGEIGSIEVAKQMGKDMPEGLWSNAYELFYAVTGPAHEAFNAKLRQKTGTNETLGWPVVGYTGSKFLTEAIRKAGTTDTDKVIAALEGLTIETPLGPQTMRASDHQANRGQFWGQLTTTDKYPFKILQPVKYVPADDLM